MQRKIDVVDDFNGRKRATRLSHKAVHDKKPIS